jgi:methionyl aminopeptidase
MKLVKTPPELLVMKEGGQKLAVVLEELLKASLPGVQLKAIDALAQKLIAKAGGTPSFQTVSGYKWATCLCVNDVVVHGVPSDYRLVSGDVLTVDVGILYKGFHTDTAWTIIIGDAKDGARADRERFLRVGEEALWKAIRVARAGNRIGHISQEIQKTIKGAGFSVVRSLVGHGIGKTLHEAPQVPGFLSEPLARTFGLKAGMTIAIEVIYAQKKPHVIYDTGDGWSIATKDGTLSSVFEHTIAITEADPLVLTVSGLKAPQR